MPVVRLSAAATLLVACGTLLPAPGGAQTYPTRPVRLIVGFAAGGAVDISARAIALKLSESLGQQVVVDNRPGAAQNLAAELVVRSAPDGHTLLYANAPIAMPSLFARLPFDVRKDLAPVSLGGYGPLLLTVHPSLPVKSVRELIALAKARPGELNYASTGTGTAGHLVGELFKGLAQVSYVHIPYKGGGPAVIDLVSGQVQFMFATAASVMQHVRSGRLRALAVTSGKRSPSLPELPTIAETGLRGFEAITWHGVVVPAATPVPIIERINAEFNAVLGLPETRERLSAQGVEPRGGTPAEFASFLRSEIPKWTKVVRDSGAKVN